MKVIKCVDLYDNYYGEDGQLYEKLIQSNFTVPCIIEESDIISITPYFGRNGKLFKNVSILENRYGSKYKVVGNYDKLNEQMNNPKRNKIGYGN